MLTWFLLISVSLVALGLGAVILGLQSRFAKTMEEAESRINKLRHDLGATKRQIPIDIATGLGTANQLEDDWARLSALHRRRGDQFSFVAVRVTDAGHGGEPVEPALMRSLAEKLVSLTRTEDHSYRLDVDTFGFLLSNCGIDGSSVFVDRVKQALANTPWAGTDHSVFIDTITGAAEWNEELESLHGLIKAAIKAAMEDKRKEDERRDRFIQARNVA